MKIELTEELISSVLPNTLITVDEETPLSARIEPYVADSVRWLEVLVTDSVQLPPELEEMAVRAVLLHAVIHAVPALDLVVTPTGFGVVSSDGLVPASKERIERLISSLSKNLDSVVLRLQKECVNCPEWRESPRGRWYCSTFFPYLEDAAGFAREGQDVYQAYRTAREIAAELEARLSEEYLGHTLMQTLRTGIYDGTYDGTHPVISVMRRNVVKYVSWYLKPERPGCPNEHEIWHMADSVIRQVRRYPELCRIWKDEMQEKFEIEPFRNTRKGGYFF